jgi:serine/threonine protein kinase
MGEGATSPQTFGDYKVFEEIGHGGMASIHIAETRSRDGKTRRVALKRLLPKVQSNRELVNNFIAEGKLLRSLHHENIAETYEVGRVYDSYFIAMEYVPGPTLKQLVAQCGLTVGAVPMPVMLNLAAQLCDALDHAHNARDESGKPLGIVHRDVSPANIILSNSGLVKLIDFGLAKANLTQTETAVGTIKGKFGYVAPEYMAGKLDARADLWAVGVVMYELLTSRRLFDGPDPFETMARVRKLPIPRPSLANPRVSPQLDSLVMKALERDPSRRWQTAAELRDALREVIDQPENYVDNRHVIDWVNWVFTQKPGTEASGISKLAAMTRPPPGALPDVTVVDRPEEHYPQLAWLESDKVVWAVLAYLAIACIGSLWQIISLIS